MPPVEVELEKKPSDEQPAQAAKSTIGIIYPPPEVRNIVDKTASFVARNGPEFEVRIRQNELNNPKFNFLTQTDPYNAYYRHKVREFLEGRGGQEPSAQPKSGLGYMQQKPQSESIIKIIEPVIPKEPPPEYEFISDPPSISAIDMFVFFLLLWNVAVRTINQSWFNVRFLIKEMMSGKSPQHKENSSNKSLVDCGEKERKKLKSSHVAEKKSDIVKLTAQFTARNGRQFLTSLMQRENRNYQFDFLRPQHSLFNYFTKLVEQYTKILIPPKDLVAKLKAEIENPQLILDQAKYRVEWAKYQDRERKRVEDEKEKERVAYAQIDWHDFVVVETVDYQPGEEGSFPPPTTPDEVGARVLAQERFDDEDEDDEREGSDEEEDVRRDLIGGEDSEAESKESGDENDDDVEGDDVDDDKAMRSKAAKPAAGADTNVQDMEEDSDPDEPDEEDMLAVSRTLPDKLPPLPPPPPGAKDSLIKPPPLPPNPEQVLIKRDYNPKVLKSMEKEVADKFLISPITGEKIEADKIQEHMRIGLLDPKWKEQKDRSIAERKEQEEVYAHGSSIGNALRLLSERRTDIFGSGIEETQIGKKIGEEEKKDKAPKVVWDGHSGSMEKVAQKARENITIQDQIAVIHKVQGLVADDDKEKIGPAMPKRGGVAPPPPPPQSAPAPPRPPILPPAPISRPVNPPVPPPRPPMPTSAPLPNSSPMMMMTPQPPQQQPILGIRPPMPPILGAPMSQPFMMRGQGAPPPPMRPPMAPMARPPQVVERDDEPPHKKSKTEEQLIPEHVFLSQHQGPVTFRVHVPNVTEKSEWKLNGQMFSVTLPLTDSIAVIKAKVFDETGMPAGKQKLQLDGMFMKDSNTLAFYNFTPASVVNLQLKERGGRKK